MERIIYRTPAEVDFVELNYCESAAGDTLAVSNWMATDSQISVNNASPPFTGFSTKAWITGGTISLSSEVINTVDTNNGELLKTSVIVIVQAYNFIEDPLYKFPVPAQIGQFATYTLDWHKRLLKGTDTIVQSSWTSSGSGLDVNAAPGVIGSPPSTTSAWMMADAVGTYIVTNTVVTAQARTLQASFLVTVKQFVNTTNA